MKTPKTESIAIIGPTASGKTNLAVALAHKLDGEIISIDSRQFYRKMDIGTGKDLHEYGTIPFHLIDIAEAGTQLNVSDFKKHFYQAYDDIISRDKTAILCGGTGNYLLALLKENPYTEISINETLRADLEKNSHEALIELINDYNIPDNYTPDLSTKKRSIRALEILVFLKTNALPISKYATISPILFGLNPNQATRRKRISNRLKNRLENGMIEEVMELRKTLSDEQIIYYGLEYKYITSYLNQSMSYDQCTEKLETEIHRFAKRQMTFFRKIEKDGFPIDWINETLSTEQKTAYILKNTQ